MGVVVVFNKPHTDVSNPNSSFDNPNVKRLAPISFVKGLTRDDIEGSIVGVLNNDMVKPHSLPMLTNIWLIHILFLSIPLYAKM